MNLKYILLPLFFLSTFWACNLHAQDPVAKQILDQIKDNVLSESRWKFEFDLEIRFPEMEPEQVKGSLYQDENKFRADIGDQIIISDGTSVWTWLKEFNEVQITDAEAGIEEIFLSPAQIVKIYESGEYDYQHSGTHAFRGQPHEFIEFKPASPSGSEYVKINMFVNMSDKLPVAVSVISRNGVVYNLSIENHQKGIRFPDSIFKFAPSEFPGAEIEDLRLN
ncbi:MAG: outer membrane lipoprotein carrier protein LolA [Saprospirales bacterium]|nr:MAG: outer membrane lipoprotein carrier protein LolA [Saprospirales bacterium]